MENSFTRCIKIMLSNEYIFLYKINTSAYFKFYLYHQRQPSNNETSLGTILIKMAVTARNICHTDILFDCLMRVRLGLVFQRIKSSNFELNQTSYVQPITNKLRI